MMSARALAILFCCYALVAVPAIAVLMPPFQAADELAHAERADQIALGLPLGRRNADGVTAGGPAHAGLDRLAAPFEPLRFHPATKLSAAMLAGESAGWGAVEWLPFPNTAIYPPVFYLPAAAGLRIGRIAGASVWHTVILARLLGGLASVAIAALAIALAEGAAPLLFSICCLPMAFALFAAISQDGLMIGCAALSAVLLARPAVAAPRWGFGVACGLLALVVMARPAYLPLAAAPLLAPDRSWRAGLSGAALVLLCAVDWAVLTGRSVMPADAARHVAQQIDALREHPSLLKLLLHTTVHKQIVEGLPVGREFIGVLGWLDTTLPNPYYALAGLALLFAAASSRSTAASPARAAAAAIMATGTVCAVHAAQYLSWSRIGGAFVDGVQGRYFLPLAPFLLHCLPNRNRDPSRRPPGRRIARATRIAGIGLCAFPALSIAVTLRAIVVRYGIGWDVGW